MHWDARGDTERWHLELPGPAAAPAHTQAPPQLLLLQPCRALTHPGFPLGHRIPPAPRAWDLGPGCSYTSKARIPRADSWGLELLCLGARTESSSSGEAQNNSRANPNLDSPAVPKPRKDQPSWSRTSPAARRKRLQRCPRTCWKQQLQSPAGNKQSSASAIHGSCREPSRHWERDSHSTHWTPPHLETQSSHGAAQAPSLTRACSSSPQADTAARTQKRCWPSHSPCLGKVPSAPSPDGRSTDSVPFCFHRQTFETLWNFVFPFFRPHLKHLNCQSLPSSSTMTTARYPG